MNDTLIWAWKPTVDIDINSDISNNLFNRTNFLLQHIVNEQLFVKEILYNSSQSVDGIVTAMGTEGHLWLNSYNAINNLMDSLALVVDKTAADISPITDMRKITTELEFVGDGSIRLSGSID